MLIRIVHTTKFIYAGTAQNNFNEVRLRPMDDDFQTCKRFSLTTWPASTPREYSDFYGNSVYYFDVPETHKELVVEVQFDHVTGNRFRHGTRLLRWRPDKAPHQCTLEQIAAPAAEVAVS